MRHKNKFKAVFKDLFGHSSGEHKPDLIFISSLAVLCFLGLLMLSSASSVQAFQKFNDSYYFLKHQITRGLLPGLLAFVLLSRISYRYWKKYAFWLLVISLALLVLVFIPGIGVVYNNAHSWIKIGGLSFQPTEVVKLTFLIYLASWFDKKNKQEMKNPEYSLIPLLSLLGLIIFLILAQPDTGSLLIILAIALMVYFAAGAPWKYILSMVAAGLIVLIIAVQIAPYRLDRFTSFLHPEKDPQGKGYHISQAKLAIGTGGIFGLGIGKSRQKFNYLPEVSGDSIFAIIAEEMGFIFSLIIIILFLMLMIRGFKIARASPDNYGMLLALGITGWFSFQAFVNIAGMVAILPLTGIPLPFISYGGTALFVSLAACGILVNISKYSRT
ncbi:putative lipid II flippase FtsW [Patescibacteria group bacterium]|nr:putative lipid II flippase FtsW [Patescibacteria group bacterium]